MNNALKNIIAILCSLLVCATVFLFFIHATIQRDTTTTDEPEYQENELWHKMYGVKDK